MKFKLLAAVAATTTLFAFTTPVFADDEPDERPVDTTTAVVEEPTTTAAPEPTTTEAPPDTTAAVVDETTTTPEPTTTAAADTTTSAVAIETATTVSGHTADQATIIAGTVVAESNSGGNNSVNEGVVGVAIPGADIDTGSATAVGSQDENIVTQQASVNLVDQAMASVMQLALIINVGAALANSGANVVFGAPGDGTSGAIGTGDASAVGNDIDQYITQGANGNATSEQDDDDSQLAISLWLGVAGSNSGLNSVVGTGVAGSGGSVGSGDASAIGNDSLTDITQVAAIDGSGTSQTNVTQRATVLNIGFALANSGVNDISNAAGDLLTATEPDDVTEQLFVMLLPALLQQYGYGGGTGAVATGDATAVGNQSQTYIKQIASAVASGDGIASIAQDVIVANVGAASANTGGNSLGRSIEELDPQTATAVVSLSAFLAAILAQVHNATAAQELMNESMGIDVPFGDLILTISGRLDGYDTVVQQGGTTATIRQIVVVISLGVARANTGSNIERTQDTPLQPGDDPNPDDAIFSTTEIQRTAEVNTDAALQAIAAIQTGQADTINRTLVIICQRIDAPEVECLRPPPPPEAPISNPETPVTTVVAATASTVIERIDLVQTTSTAAPVEVRGGVLPSTGGDISDPLRAGAVLFLMGAFALIIVRRRPKMVS